MIRGRNTTYDRLDDVSRSFMSGYFNDNFSERDLNICVIGSPDARELTDIDQEILSRSNVVVIDPASKDETPPRCKSFQHFKKSIFSIDPQQLFSQSDIVLSRYFMHHCTEEQRESIINSFKQYAPAHARFIVIDWFIPHYESLAQFRDSSRRYYEYHAKFGMAPGQDKWFRDDVLEPNFKGGKFACTEQLKELGFQERYRLGDNGNTPDPELLGLNVMVLRNGPKLTDHYMSRFIDNAMTNMKRWLGGMDESPKVIFDIGANVGLYSLAAARIIPDSVVYAFEPVKQNYDTIVQHVQMNGLADRIKVFNFGLWSSDTQMSLGIPEDRDHRNTGLYSSFHSDGDFVTPGQFRVLDNWCKENDVWPDFMKIDVEGAEYEILYSSPACISKAKRIVTEHNTKDTTLPDPLRVSSLLKDAGFVASKEKYDIAWSRQEEE